MEGEKTPRKSGSRPKRFGKRKFTGNPQTRAKEAESQNLGKRSTSSAPKDTSRTPTPKRSRREPEAGPSTSKDEASSAEPVESISSRKLRTSLDPEVDPDRNDWSGFRVVDQDLLFRDICDAVICKLCKEGTILITEKSTVGLYSVYDMVCSDCGVVKEVQSCGKIGGTRKAPEANRRAVYASKSLGFGHSGWTEFSALMDFPPPFSKKAFGKAVEAIHTATEEVALDSMKEAAVQEKELNESNDVTVSGDGSWMKRGFTSLFGVVTLIGLLTGKVIDFVVLSLVCSGCTSYQGPKSGDQFEEWKVKHEPKCTRNHEGSSGSMEVKGMTQLFARSVAERGLRYVKYIGDGDSKTFKTISESKPYDNTEISKLECTAHVKKRMGTRLRKAVEENKGKKIGNKTGIGGAGRLTKKMIDKISDYYGMAVQSNKDVQSMKDAIWAIYYHISSSDKKPTHHLCPQGPESWCPYQKAVAAGKAKDYKHNSKNIVPLEVMEACKKVFKDLSDEDLLERCVGGFTQNPNESINALIWQTCPKVKYFGKRTVDIATGEAVINFNDGLRGKIKVLKKLQITPGKHCVSWAIARDEERVAKADDRAQAATKAARIEKKRQKEAALEKSKDDSYVPGGY